MDLLRSSWRALGDFYLELSSFLMSKGSFLVFLRDSMRGEGESLNQGWFKICIDEELRLRQ